MFGVYSSVAKYPQRRIRPWNNVGIYMDTVFPGAAVFCVNQILCCMPIAEQTSEKYYRPDEVILMSVCFSFVESGIVMNAVYRTKKRNSGGFQRSLPMRNFRGQFTLYASSDF